MTATDELREYKCKYYRLCAHPKSCFFCDHCTDIFFDSEGPYMFFCDVDSDTDRGLQGVCQKFCEVDE